MTAKELLLKIKKAFEEKKVFDTTTPPPAPPPAAPADTTTASPSAYAVDGGGTIYVDNSDDGIADIDTADKVYSDPAMTVPYPDGTYKVTGTDFGFTVAAGIVGTVTDPDGTGPGAPITDPGAMATPPVPPVTATPPPAKSMEQRMTELEAALANMGVKCEAAIKAERDKVIKHENTIKEMFTLIDMLVKEPTAEPRTTTPATKTAFDRAEKRNEKFQQMAENLKKIASEKKV